MLAVLEVYQTKRQARRQAQENVFRSQRAKDFSVPINILKKINY